MKSQTQQEYEQSSISDDETITNLSDSDDFLNERMKEKPALSFAVIGAGFSGINAAIQLQKNFPDARVAIFEKGCDYGGAWLWNTYPGCEPDVPSHFYSLSYERNPRWTHAFAPRSEIHAYLKSVALKYNLPAITRFQTHVESVRWNENKNQFWLTYYPTTGSNRKPTSEWFQFVISATGPLHVPKIPSFKGLQDFQGRVMHTGQWDNSYDLDGKRIIVIGTGSSGVQIIPELQKKGNVV
jgi:cation diffusion facilitator CzcD-associated flavoprotein CzcO